MTVDDSRIAQMRRVAIACACLVLMIVGISAFIRLSAAGLGCAPWPQCYGQTMQPLQSGVLQTADSGASQAITLARFAHRFLAVLLLPLMLFLVIAGFSIKPKAWHARWLSVFALLLVLFLAVLGRWTAGVRVPAVALGNLLGGFLLFGVFWRMAVLKGRSEFRPKLPVPVRVLNWLVALILLSQILLGGLVSSSFAGLSCPSLAGCTVATPLHWDALNLLREPTFDASQFPVNADGALAHLLHRWGAAVATVMVLAFAIALLRSGRSRKGFTLLLLTGSQLLVGMGMVVAGLPLAMAVAHNLIAALVLASLLSVD